MADHMGLNKLVALAGHQSAGNVLSDAGVDILTKYRGFWRNSDCMQVDNTEKAFIFNKHAGPVSHGTQIISKGQLTGGLGTGEYDRFRFARSKYIVHYDEVIIKNQLIIDFNNQPL